MILVAFIVGFIFGPVIDYWLSILVFDEETQQCVSQCDLTIESFVKRYVYDYTVF